jgi:hypothetical protein
VPVCVITAAIISAATILLLLLFFLSLSECHQIGVNILLLGGHSVLVFIQHVVGLDEITRIVIISMCVVILQFFLQFSVLALVRSHDKHHHKLQFRSLLMKLLLLAIMACKLASEFSIASNKNPTHECSFSS